MDDLRNLQDRVRRLEMLNLSDGTRDETTALGATSPVEFTPITPAPAVPPSANQIRNGDLSHSVNTWFEAVAAPGTDKVLECAWWFVHDAPAAGQALNFTDARTNSVNKTLKAPGHSQYDASYPDWGLPDGIVRLTGDKSIHAPFPGNSVFPGRPMYLGAIIARRNATIVVPDDCRIAAMLYNNEPGSEDFMKSANVFHLDGFVRGAPAGTTERRYKVLAETDRGYEFLSDELVLAAAPNDASFSSDVDVFLSWPRIEGVLRYRVFRHNVVAGTFDELQQITSGTNTYGDNNFKLDDNVGAYPAATDDRIKCYVATVAGALRDLAVNGVALIWDSLFLNIPVPSPLAASGSGFQVLRIALTKACDRQMNDAISTAGSNSIESASAEFTALDTGRMATLKAPDGTVLHGPEAITFVDATHVTFATNVATTNAGATLYIVGGGDHGILLDMVHIGYISRSAYAPFFEDLNRALPSTAAPNSSSQGGIGNPGDSGDPGDGGLGRDCIEVDTPVTVLFGNTFVTKALKNLGIGEVVKSRNHVPNVIQDHPRIGSTDNLYILKTKNGMVLPCSPGERVFTSFTDLRGRPANCLRIGDYVLTCNAGRDECSPLIECNATGRSAAVGTISLSPGHQFLAGKKIVKWWQRPFRWLLRRRRPAGPSGIYVHNLKPLDFGLT